MPRFTISKHDGGPDGDHYDLFLESQGALKTWRVDAPDFASPRPALKIQDHRLPYLDQEGPVSGDRGKVTIWDRGEFSVDSWSEKRIQVALAGAKIKGRLRMEASKDTVDAWTLSDPTAAIKHKVSAFLRGVALDPAPERELDEIGVALMEEERRILAQVDRFNRGTVVDWTAVRTDGALRGKIAKARSRWRHPWMAQATAFADGLDRLAKSLQP